MSVLLWLLQAAGFDFEHTRWTSLQAETLEHAMTQIYVLQTIRGDSFVPLFVALFRARHVSMLAAQRQ